MQIWKSMLLHLGIFTKKFKPEELDEYRYNHNINNSITTSTSINRDKYLSMRPDKVYKLSKNINSEIENLKKQAKEFEDVFDRGFAKMGTTNAIGYTIDEKLLITSKENLKYIHQTIRLKEQELKDIELSGATKTRDYIQYADVKSREEKAVDFIENNLYHDKAKGFFKNILNMDVVKSSILKICNSRLCNLQKDAATLENKFKLDYANYNYNDYDVNQSLDIKLSSYLEHNSLIDTHTHALNNPDGLHRMLYKEEDLEFHKEELSKSINAKELFEAREESFSRASKNSIAQKIKKKIHELKKEKDFNKHNQYSSPKEQIDAIINRIERNKNDAKENSNRISGLSMEANNRVNELLRQAEAKECYNGNATVNYEYENDDLSI